MRRLQISLSLAVALLLALGTSELAVPASALAAGDPVIADCNANGGLTGHYSLRQLQHALRTMPPSVREYSNCSDVIQRQLSQVLGVSSSGRGSGSGGGSGESFLPTPLIVVEAALMLGAAALAAQAVRRRRDARRRTELAD